MEGKLYILFDWINDKLVLASFDKQEILAKIGEDYLECIDVDSYVLKSVRIEDLEDEI